MKFKNRFNQIKRKLHWLLMVGFVMPLGNAWANLPNRNDLLPTDVAGESGKPLDLAFALGRLVLGWAGVIIGACIFIGVGWNIYQGYKKALESKENGWSQFFVTVIVGAVVALMGIVLIIMALEWV
jgi:cytochrome b561